MSIHPSNIVKLIHQLNRTTGIKQIIKTVSVISFFTVIYIAMLSKTKKKKATVVLVNLLKSFLFFILSNYLLDLDV